MSAIRIVMAVVPFVIAAQPGTQRYRRGMGMSPLGSRLRGNDEVGNAGMASIGNDG